MRRATMAVFGLCLLAATPTSGQEGVAFGRPGGDMDLEVSRFIKVSLLDFGLYGGTIDQPIGLAMSLRAANVTCVLNRFRFGVAFCDGYASPDWWAAGMLLPIHVGFTLWSNLRPVGPVWAALPDAYVEASAGLWGVDAEGLLFGAVEPYGFALQGRLALCCDVDFLGVGARIEAGGLSLIWNPGERFNSVYGIFQLRLPAFNIAF